MTDLSRSPLAPFMHKIYPVSMFLGYRPPARKGPAEMSTLDRFWHKPAGQLAERTMRMFIGAWTGIALLTVIARSHVLESRQSPIAIGSFGAVMVVIYSIPGAPFAQPRNVIIGNTMAALIATAITHLFALNKNFRVGDINGPIAWAAAATVTATATAFNELIFCQHPPSGATALLASILPQIHQLSWWYPGLVFVSACLTVAWACIVNNLSPTTSYPHYWVSPSLFSDREAGTGRLKSEALVDEKRDPRNQSTTTVGWKSRSESQSPARSVDPFENRIQQVV